MNPRARLAKIEEQLDRRRGFERASYAQYIDDPVGFGEQVLGDTYPDEVKQLMESVRDNQITVAQSCTAFGKTHAAARIATWWYAVHDQCQVYTAAAPPESNLKKLLWGEIGSIAVGNPEVFVGSAQSSLHINRSPNVFLTGVTIPASGSDAIRESRFSGKHSRNLLFILDEGDAIPDEVYRGIDGCMSGGNARLLIMFNPRAATGSAYRLIRDSRASVVKLSALCHPNVVTGTDGIPGAVTRETTLRRIHEWCRPLTEGEKPDEECFELPEFLVGCGCLGTSGVPYAELQAGFYKVIDPAFSYMVLGRYPAQGSTQLISREWITAARARYDAYVKEHGDKIPPDADGVMGVDVSEFGSDANVVCTRYGTLVKPFDTWKGMDTVTTGDKILSLYEQAERISTVNIDATGVGAGVAPQLQRNGCAAVSVKVASSATLKNERGTFRCLRDQLCWEAREWLRTDPASMLPPDNELEEEMLAIKYYVEGGKLWVTPKGASPGDDGTRETLRKLLRRSPDKFDAFTYTFAKGGFFAGCRIN